MSTKLTKKNLADILASRIMEIIEIEGARFHMVRGSYVRDDHAYYVRQYSRTVWTRELLEGQVRALALHALTRPDFDPIKIHGATARAIDTCHAHGLI